MKKQKVIEIDCCDICETDHNLTRIREGDKYFLCEKCRSLLGKKINELLEENNYAILDKLVNQIKKEIPLFKLKQ